MVVVRGAPPPPLAVDAIHPPAEGIAPFELAVVSVPSVWTDPSTAVVHFTIAAQARDGAAWQTERRYSDFVYLRKTLEVRRAVELWTARSSAGASRDAARRTDASRDPLRRVPAIR